MDEKVAYLEKRVDGAKSGTETAALSSKSDLVLPDDLVEEIDELSERLKTARKAAPVDGLKEDQLKQFHTREETKHREVKPHLASNPDILCLTSCQRGDQQWLVSGGSDGQVCITDASSMALLSKFEAHEAAVTTLAIHPDVDMALTGSKDGTLRLTARHWGDWENYKIVREHKSEILCADIHPLGSLCLSLEEEGRVILLDLESGKLLAEKNFGASIAYASFHVHGKAVLSAGPKLQLSDVRTLKDDLVFDQGEYSSIQAGVFQNGYLIASCKYPQHRYLAFSASKRGTEGVGYAYRREDSESCNGSA